ncbi:MAG: MmgE/PrpD family protein [Chloroflexi bacterium]|nr:MmgE/PrpD family protein [Chloroflexota bacterium]
MAVVARSIVNRLPFLPESRSTESPDSVSVIIPARNEEESIERTVRSILAQTHRGVDLIVVNDHSTDSTGVILDRISANEQRLQVIHDPALHALIGKITIEEDEEFTRRYPQEFNCRMEVTDTSGRIFEVHTPHPKGNRHNPLNDAEVEDKFRRLSQEVLNQQQCGRVLELAWAFDEQSSLDPLFNSMVVC